MSVLRIEVPESRRAEREYAARLLVETCLGLACQVESTNRTDTLIHAGDPASASVRVADGLLGVPADDWLTERSLPPGPILRWDASALVGAECAWGHAVPVLYTAAPRSGAWLTGGGLHQACRADLFGSAFFMATRYEEHVLTDRDAHGRFPGSASLAAREGFLERPVVDEWADVLGALLRAVWPGLPSPDRRYGVRPTHDVDRALREFGHAGAGRNALRQAWQTRTLTPMARWLQFERGQPGVDDYDQFSFLMDASERSGLQSEFYFQGYCTSPGLDAEYRLDSPFMQRTLRRIQARGHRIGIHPGYGAPRDPQEIVSRTLANVRYFASKAGVRQELWGGRHHYLRWMGSSSWRAWQDAGLDYDSSVGFADLPGFRCGLCREFPVFDLLAGAPLRLRERPLVAMDATLTWHLGLSRAAVADRLSALAAACRQHGGEFVFLWHNSRLQSDVDRSHYSEVVQRVAGHG